MLKYSFMGRYSECSKEEAIELLKETDKQILYTHGLGYREPTINKVPVSKEKALEYADESLVDITEYEDYIHVNTYSGNDLF